MALLVLDNCPQCLSQLKNSFYEAKQESFFIQDKCFHLMLSLYLMEPEWTFFKVIVPSFKKKGVHKFSIPFFYQRKWTNRCMKANARIKKTVLHCENIWATFLIGCCFIHSFSHNFCVLSMSVHVSRDWVALIKNAQITIWRLIWKSLTFEWNEQLNSHFPAKTRSYWIQPRSWSQK